MSLGLLGSALAGALGTAATGMGQSMMEDDKLQRQSDLALERQKKLDDMNEEREVAKADRYTKAIEIIKNSKLDAAVASVPDQVQGPMPDGGNAGLVAQEQLKAKGANGIKLTQDEILEAGLKSGAIKTSDYVTAKTRASTTEDKLFNMLQLAHLRETGKDTRQDKDITARMDRLLERLGSNEDINDKKIAAKTTGKPFKPHKVTMGDIKLNESVLGFPDMIDKSKVAIDPTLKRLFASVAGSSDPSQSGTAYAGRVIDDIRKAAKRDAKGDTKLERQLIVQRAAELQEKINNYGTAGPDVADTSEDE